MNKSLLRTCLLILLSITLPLQAAVAASKGGCLHHANAAGTEHHAAQPPLAAADHGTPGTAADDAPCPHHQAAGAPAASPAPDCSSCDWCCLGSALPSQALHWPAQLEQPLPVHGPAWAHVSPPLRTLERPPRAPLFAA